MTAIDVLRTIHIAGGAAALASLWIPLIAAKGGRLHRRAGWVFVAGMGVVAATAIALCVHRFLLPPAPGNRTMAVFLGYLGVLTGAGAYKGIRVLRTKNRTGRSRNALDLGVAAATLAFGPPTALVGYTSGFPPVLIFGIIGTIGGVTTLRYWLRPPQERMHWWYQHMSDMIGTSIAAITAFLVLNARHFGLGTWSTLVWVGPTLIGVPLLLVWLRHYRRRFGDGTTTAPPRDSSNTGTSVGEVDNTGAVPTEAIRFTSGTTHA